MISSFFKSFWEISYHLTRLNSNTIALNRIGIQDNLVKEKFGNPNLRLVSINTVLS